MTKFFVTTSEHSTAGLLSMRWFACHRQTLAQETRLHAQEINCLGSAALKRLNKVGLRWIHITVLRGQFAVTVEIWSTLPAEARSSSRPVQNAEIRHISRVLLLHRQGNMYKERFVSHRLVYLGGAPCYMQSPVQRGRPYIAGMVAALFERKRVETFSSVDLPSQANTLYGRLCWFDLHYSVAMFDCVRMSALRGFVFVILSY